MVKTDKKAKYKREYPEQMYEYFVSFSDKGAPSFGKFAIKIGVRLSELEGFRVHNKFDVAWRECSEIRRDYLIDAALTRRFDPSLVKFLLSAEFGMGENDKGCAEDSIELNLRVISD